MTPPGPPPKPNEAKRRAGNPGKRALPDLNNVIALPQVAPSSPAHLGPIASQMWSELRDRAPWIATTDQPNLLLLCEKWERRAHLQALLASSDFVLYTDKGYAYANPLVGMLSTLENEIAKLLSLLGLTPTDRTRLGLAEVKTASKLQQMMGASKGA